SHGGSLSSSDERRKAGGGLPDIERRVRASSEEERGADGDDARVDSVVGLVDERARHVVEAVLECERDALDEEHLNAGAALELEGEVDERDDARPRPEVVAEERTESESVTPVRRELREQVDGRHELERALERRLDVEAVGEEPEARAHDRELPDLVVVKVRRERERDPVADREF